MKRRFIKLSRFLSGVYRQMTGAVIAVLFLILAADGKLGFQLQSREPNWFWDFPDVPDWLCWIVALYGLKMAIFNERAEYWLFQKVKGLIRKLKGRGGKSLKERLEREE